MRKMKLSLIGLALAAIVVAAIPTSAESDPYAETVAFIDWSVYHPNKVRGKAYASTTNPKMTKINVQGSFYQGSTLKESGVASQTIIGYEAAWYTADGVYADTNSYTLNAASRTYYNGGSYDQQYDSYSWPW